MLVDAGNALFKKHARVTPSSLQNAHTILTIYDKIGFDVFCPGPGDLISGLQPFKVFTPENLTIISSNLYLTKSKQPFFQQAKQVQAGSNVITIFGLTGEGMTHTKEYYLEDSVTVLNNLISLYRQKTDYFVLLSSLPLPENKKLANTFPELSIIVSADNRLTSISPQRHQNSIIVQTVNRGKYIGSIDIFPGQSHQWGTDFNNILQSKRRTLSSLQYQLKLKKHQRQQETNSIIESLVTKIQTTERELDEIERAKEEDDIRYSRYLTKNHKLGNNVKNNEEIDKLINR